MYIACLVDIDAYIVTLCNEVEVGIPLIGFPEY